jgi:hypothetical protein
MAICRSLLQESKAGVAQHRYSHAKVSSRIIKVRLRVNCTLHPSHTHTSNYARSGATRMTSIGRCCCENRAMRIRVTSGQGLHAALCADCYKVAPIYLAERCWQWSKLMNCNWPSSEILTLLWWSVNVNNNKLGYSKRKWIFTNLGGKITFSIHVNF